MYTRRIALATVLALSLGTTGSGVATGVGDDELAAAAAANNEDDAIRFRKDFSLLTDAALVARLATDAKADLTWGVPLTSAEAAEISRRAKLPEQASAALAWADTQASYAGSYIDNEAGGVLVVQFADADVAAERGAVAARTAAGATYDVRSADLSLRELERLRGAIDGDRDWFKSIGSELIATSLDTRSNALLVGVSNYTAAIGAAVRARFGAHVQVGPDSPSVADACTVNSCWPQKGGIKIWPTALTSHICTTGFIVRYGNPVGYGLLTAGHCIKGGWTGNWAHNSHVIGKPTPHTYYAGKSADAVVIKMTVEDPPTATLNYYLWEDDDVRAINRVAPLAEQVKGSPVCMQGWGMRDFNPANNGRKCGTITAEHVDRPSCLDTRKTDCVMMHNLYEMSFDTHPGDSGGPVTTGCCTATGLVTDSEWDDDPNNVPNRSWYSTIVWSMSEIDNVTGGVRWRVCLNATCTNYY